VTDLDGDSVSLTATLDEVGTDGCTSRLGPVAAGALAFDTRCVDATRLIGLASRNIRVIAADGNGGSSEVVFPVEIGNRPPALRLASNPAGGHVTLDHTVGACPGALGSCFLATGTATFAVVDPDGDPVTGPTVTATLQPWLTSSTGEATTAAGVATFRFATALPVPGEFRAIDGSTSFSLVASSADPFGASSSLGVPVVVGNRPPVLKSASASVAVGHRYDQVRQAYLATAPLSSFEDPDGDPLRTDGSAGDSTCPSPSFSGGDGWVDCVRGYVPASGPPPLSSFVGNHPVVLRAFDGWEGVTSATVVNIQDGAPTASAFDGVVESCFCACSKWSADGSTCVGQGRWVADTASVPLPVNAGDIDGDPVQVTFSPATASGTQKTVFPGGCSSILLNPVLPITVQVTIDDGVGRVQTTSRVTGVSCPTAGQACEP
jgi:hypothetical protein